MPLQIAELYEENQQEKLKNEMLSECLRDQKHAKAKLMKACKHVKQELQAMKDSGLRQMLVDIEARCDALEKENAQMVVELFAERSLVRWFLPAGVAIRLTYLTQFLTFFSR